jgi:hypothetical protein
MGYVAQSEPSALASAMVRALELWRQQRANLDAERDQLVRYAHSIGVPKARIHRATGLARTTIDTILEGAPPE